MLTSLERNVLVANRIARILGIFTLLLLVYLVYSFGININSPLILTLCIFFFAIPFLNKAGFKNLTRILICIVPVVFTLVAAILAKVFGRNFTDILYYDSRFFLIIFSIIPCLIFDTTERWQLYLTCGTVFLALVLFDPVHEYFNVGYFQLGFTGRSYYYINVVVMITFLCIIAGAITLKRAVEKTERQNQKYKASLQETNQKLQESFNDIEAQNEEIIAQSEELSASQESLIEANRTIEKQKAALEIKVDQVNGELQEANEELFKHNNELQQFSYTLSHNLRGPIARLLGLNNLIKFTPELNEHSGIKDIIGHIQTSVKELDVVVRDLNSILEIRHAMYQIREEVDFQKEWREIKQLLNVSDSFESSHFSIDFSAAPTVFSVRPMVGSIMLNMISNSIKYQDPERSLMIRVSTWKNQQYTTLEVEDNGLGIDLALFQNDLFKMYKRFHDHQEGKGLGLYLIKSQVDLLNGFVEIKSKPDIGTTFSVHIKNQANLPEIPA